MDSYPTTLHVEFDLSHCVDSDPTTLSVAFDMCLHCLFMPHKRDDLFRWNMLPVWPSSKIAIESIASSLGAAK